MSLRFHFDFTSISLWPPLKPSQITVKTKRPGPTAPGDQRHQGNQRNPNIIRKTKDSLSIPLRTHAGSTREAPSSRRTTFYLISQNKVERKPKGHGSGTGGLMTIKSPATGSRTQEPFRFPGLSKPPTSDPKNTLHNACTTRRCARSCGQCAGTVLPPIIEFKISQ